MGCHPKFLQVPCARGFPPLLRTSRTVTGATVLGWDPQASGTNFAIGNNSQTVSANTVAGLARANPGHSGTGDWSWTGTSSGSGNSQFGLANASESTANYCGQTANSAGLNQADGNVYISGAVPTNGSIGLTWVDGDQITPRLKNNKLYFAKNGTYATGMDPVAETGGVDVTALGVLFPTVSNASTRSFTADLSNWATTTTNVSGASDLTLAPSATLLGTGAVSGSSALTFTNSATLLGSGAVAGSSTITFSPSATLLGGGPVVGSSTLVFSPAATLLGSGAVSGSSSLTFAPIATLLGTGQVVGSSSLVLNGSATLLGTGALLGSTALTFVGSATLTTAVSNTISGNANVTFVAGAVLTGIGQVSGATSFSLTVSGQLRASFVVMQPPAPVRITSPSPLSETNVIGPPHPSNVNVASSAVAAGTFTPAPKPSRVNWRT